MATQTPQAPFPRAADPRDRPSVAARSPLGNPGVTASARSLLEQQVGRVFELPLDAWSRIRDLALAHVDRRLGWFGQEPVDQGRTGATQAASDSRVRRARAHLHLVEEE